MSDSMELETSDFVALEPTQVIEESYGCESQASMRIWRIKEQHTSFPKCPHSPHWDPSPSLVRPQVGYSSAQSGSSSNLPQALFHRNPGAIVCTAGEKALFLEHFPIFYSHFMSFLKPLYPPHP